MAKKPRFLELPESEFDNRSTTVEGSHMSSSSPNICPVYVQSEESKAIKRYNMQIKNLYKWIPGEDNYYIHAWKKAADDADMELDYKIVDGEKVFVIRNTIHNRWNIDEFRRLLTEYNAKSKTDIRNQVKEELRSEGLKLNKENIDARLEERAAYATLDSNLDFIYYKDPNGRGKLNRYAELLRGYSRADDPRGYAERVVKIAREVGELRRKERATAKQELTGNKLKRSKIDVNKPR